MALKVVNTESLDRVADAINAKSGTSGAIQFPDGFVDAIEAIQAGGGEDLSTALTEQEELVAELKSIIAQKAKLGDAKLPSILDKTVTELTAEDLAGCTTIGRYVLYNCYYLTRLELGEVSVIDDESVEYAGSKVSTDFPLVIPSTVRKIGQYAFNKSGITSLRIEGGGDVFVLDTRSFAYCSRLKSVYIGSRTIKIGNYIFADCGVLEQVTLEEGFKDLATGIFSGCYTLKNIALPSSVYMIRSGAFTGCSHLEYIDLTAYGTDGAFPTLTNINAFTNCGTATASGTFEIRVPSGRKAELAAMTNWSTYADNIVEVN